MSTASESSNSADCPQNDSSSETANIPGIDTSELINLKKPAQYLGGEVNSTIKTGQEIDTRIALAFPDTYEVGMSHLGMQILYDLINRDQHAAAERCYMPLPDMEHLLRTKELALHSLETKRPLSDFNAIGFSLQYELCGTNILAMLDLAGLPLYAEQRSDSMPLVIAGGPYSYHPEAIAPFIDCFFLGDAEEFIPELISALRAGQVDGVQSKKKVLEILRSVEGIYLPADYDAVFKEDGTLQEITPKNGAPEQIVRRLLPSMEGAPYPKKPIVPNVSTVHNRLSLEVMRGCVRGCRFCQAGYLYRPQRERSPQEIVEMMKEAVPQTGFEEVSLLSLSTADYCSVVPLLRSLMDKYGEGDKLAISFPSTRVDALTPEVLEQVQRVRRTGFTVAPEGGSQRLRDVINKGVTDEQILETCSNVFKMGWTGIKLYFMLGLPTETDEDLEGIIDIAGRINKLPEASGKDITVSVSTHVPKPHTPFQWAEQITPNETIRKQRLLAAGLKRVGVNFRYHEHFSSFLEGIFCRSGREMSKVLVRAYELGCRLDAWREHLAEELWMQAFQDCNINPYYYLREIPVEEALPWDHLSCGIPKSYFAKEYRRAIRARETPDCLTKSCSVCGACDYDVKKNVLWPREEAEQWYEQRSTLNQEELPGFSSSAETPAMRVRLSYIKKDQFRFLGHLELVSVFHRAARRASLPVFYTRGFHPMPKLAFGPPLQLGISSQKEYVDIYFAKPVSVESICDALNSEFPPALQATEAKEVTLKEPSLSDSFCGMRYRAIWINEPTEFKNASSVEDFEEIKAHALTKEVIREAKAKKKKGKRGAKNKLRKFPLNEFLSEVSLNKDSLEFTLLFDQSRACPKPIEVVQAIAGLNVGDYSIEKVETLFAG